MQNSAGKCFTLQEFKCAYVMVIMAVFWVTEALPLAITSLIPVALLPILGKLYSGGKILPACVSTKCRDVAAVSFSRPR